MLGSAVAAAPQANYNDLAGLSQIRQLANVSEGAAYEEIGRQFESLLVHAMLKNMRSANRVWSEGGLLSSNNVSFYEDMLDQQLSVALPQSEGLGLAKKFAVDMQSRWMDAKGTEAAADLPDRQARELQLTGLRWASRSSAAKDQPLLNRSNFVDELMPLARSAGQKLRVSAEVLLAQAALETGWGEHLIVTGNGSSSHNLFGIKAHRGWQGETAEVTTHEYIGSRKVNVIAHFRAYESLQESFEDYVSFIMENPRYAAARDHQNASSSYPELLQQAGYATDPRYAIKIHDIAERIAEYVDTRASQAGHRMASAETFTGPGHDLGEVR